MALIKLSDIWMRDIVNNSVNEENITILQE